MWVKLEAQPNPDYDKYEHRGSVRIKAFRHTVESFMGASKAVRHFIQSNDLGSGNFTGGVVSDARRVVARVSYNGRVWGINGKEIEI